MKIMCEEIKFSHNSTTAGMKCFQSEWKPVSLNANSTVSSVVKLDEYYDMFGEIQEDIDDSPEMAGSLAMEWVALHHSG